MRKASASLLFLLLALGLPALGVAGTFSYPNTRSPLFSVTVPDSWKTQIENQILHAGPKDGTVYIGFVALDSGLSGDAVGDAVDKIVRKMVKDPSVDNEEQTQINGLTFHFFEGEGTQRGGSGPIKYGVAMFSPNGETICVMIYFGAPNDIQRHEKRLTGIVKSIRRG